MSWPTLSVTIFLPLVGALFIMVMRGDDEAEKRNARWVALWTTLITFAISLILLYRFDPSSAEFQFVEKRPWLVGAITYHVGVDGISLPFLILTTALMPVCIIASWLPIQHRVKEYMIAFLVLETLMVATFAVKLPMWPVHTWLPDAHVEAPTAGSVILAAILLKMGGYGFLRFSLPMFPAASHDLAPLIFALSVIAVIYTSLVALAQEDMKKLIAYSSVAHMGLVTMGIFAATTQGVAGGIFQMISHGIVSAALFLCVGVVYDRMHTREISAYGGLINTMPLYALVFMVFTMANVGLPGTSGFVGEFMALIGTFRANVPVATLATLGVILSACYALWLYRKVIFGVLEKPALMGLRDLGRREILVFAPLVILTILFGVYPKPVLDMSAASVAQLLENYQAAVAPKKAESSPPGLTRGSIEIMTNADFRWIAGSSPADRKSVV